MCHPCHACLRTDSIHARNTRARACCCDCRLYVQRACVRAAVRACVHACACMHSCAPLYNIHNRAHAHAHACAGNNHLYPYTPAHIGAGESQPQRWDGPLLPKSHIDAHRQSARTRGFLVRPHHPPSFLPLYPWQLNINFKSIRATKFQKIRALFVFAHKSAQESQRRQLSRSTRLPPVTNPAICSLHVTPESPALHEPNVLSQHTTHRNLLSIAPAYRRQHDPHQQGPIWISCFLGAFSVRACSVLLCFCAFMLLCFRAFVLWCFCALYFLCFCAFLLSVLSVLLCVLACVVAFCALVLSCFRNRPLFCAGIDGTARPAPTPTTHPTNTDPCLINFE